MRLLACSIRLNIASSPPSKCFKSKAKIHHLLRGINEKKRKEGGKNSYKKLWPNSINKTCVSNGPHRCPICMFKHHFHVTQIAYKRRNDQTIRHTIKNGNKHLLEINFTVQWNLHENPIVIFHWNLFDGCTKSDFKCVDKKCEHQIDAINAKKKKK